MAASFHCPLRKYRSPSLNTSKGIGVGVGVGVGLGVMVGVGVAVGVGVGAAKKGKFMPPHAARITAMSIKVGTDFIIFISMAIILVFAMLVNPNGR